jgi:hypothetical protein
MSRAHDPLLIDAAHTVAPEFVAVSYTRPMLTVDEDGLQVLDGAEAAKRAPSAVELRVDVKKCGAFSPEEQARIIAFRTLQADRRGVVRVVYGDGATRPQNLVGARRMMADLVCEAMRTPLALPDEGRVKRGRVGLIKPR